MKKFSQLTNKHCNKLDLVFKNIKIFIKKIITNKKWIVLKILMKIL